MRKKLLIASLLTIGYFAQAQETVMLHVENIKFFVSKNTLVSNYGGFQTKAGASQDPKTEIDGIVENHGNIMIVGNRTTDVFRTLKSDGTEVPVLVADSEIGFLNKLNDPLNYDDQPNVPSVNPNFTYGQLYITGIPQDRITGIVGQEHAAPNHGVFQQMGMPFNEKPVRTLEDELERTFPFSGERNQNSIAHWDNREVVFKHLTSLGSQSFGSSAESYAYWILGRGPGATSSTGTINFNTVKIMRGQPFSDVDKVPSSGLGSETPGYLPPLTLQDAGCGDISPCISGDPIDFGPDGNGINDYNEAYNTYLQDALAVTSGEVWTGNYGRNIYQFGNPFLTNLDISSISVDEYPTIDSDDDGIPDSADTDDDNDNIPDNTDTDTPNAMDVVDNMALADIWGIRLSPRNVYYKLSTGGGTTYSNIKVVMFDTSGGIDKTVSAGDVDDLMIRPFDTFVIKLRNNSQVNPRDFNFTKLRRFNYFPRSNGTAYNVTANKGAANGTLKQLGVIGLDADGKEIARTYYVVSPRATTSHPPADAKPIQAAAASTNILGTYEEAPGGGYNMDYYGKYWLYINEANENDFQGKNIKMVNFASFAIKSYKFEIREDAVLVPNGTHALSTGIGFYYKASNGTVKPAKQGDIISSTASVYDLFYGDPNGATLSDGTDVIPSRTIVVYNPETTHHIVIFDPNWKKADIEVFDMSGKLIISDKNVSTSTNYIIKLNNSVKSSYIVKIVSDNGEIVNTKILTR
ncbi:MAG: T9SS type A sorting domain-containing protein [Flavobacteriaceae bacterium]|jgi:hypothetical protein|nr:T9SS type A sorting domain-containing protein [Flavobacteriaceae bacterium]